MDPEILVHHASYLNTEGVQALTYGDTATAHQNFRQALQVMSQATQLSLQRDQVDVVDSGTAWSKSSLSCCPLPGFEKSDYYVCNNALLFSVQLDPGQTMDSAAIAVCCYATMFNMALTLHQRGVATGNQRNLASATRLYEQCLRLNSDLHGPRNDVNIMAMASMNNVAQIYYDLRNFDQAVGYLDSVKRLFAETDCSSPSISSLFQLDEVILNVMVTSKPSTAPCA